MKARFISKPPWAQLAQTVFRCLLVLSLVLGLLDLMTARFSPLRGTPLDLYLYVGIDFGARNGVAAMHQYAFLGFGIMWFALPRMPSQQRGLSVAALVLFIIDAALPG